MKEKNILIAILSFTVIWMGSQLWTGNNQQKIQDTVGAPTNKAPDGVTHCGVDRLPSNDIVAITTPCVHAAIDTRGARLYQWQLLRYKRSAQNNHPVSALSQKDPSDSIVFGWHGEGLCDVPDALTVWKKSGSTLTTQTPVRLSWTNKDNVMFTMTFSIDKNYMMTVDQTVSNQSAQPIRLSAQNGIQRIGNIHQDNQMIVHEGAIGSLGNAVIEKSYKNMRKIKGSVWSTMGQDASRDWIGFTDKYWLMSIIPPVGSLGSITHRYDGLDHFMTWCRSPVMTLAPGQEKADQFYVYIGPKKESILNQYKNTLSIRHFDMSIDYGRLFFLTKPLLSILTVLKDWVGSFGVAILILTVIIKGALFPFSVKSYRSMARMRQIQPKIKSLKERYAHDKMRLNQEMIALYKKEKINPASGCLPMLVQAPIFFALYKVLFISMDMRQASFLWTADLSAPDTLWLLNGFGLLPWSLPSFLQIGLWPMLMGLSMIMQQKMTASPSMDPQQQLMLTYVMPIIFAFMMSQFPVGLVIYWTWSNILTIVQQWWINKQYAI